MRRPFGAPPGCELLGTTLGRRRARGREAVSAEEAAEVSWFWSPSVAILDVGLPGVDGFRSCRELKQNPDYGGPLAVVLTGQEATTDEVKAAGPDAVICKPYSLLELIRLLDWVSEAAATLVADGGRSGAAPHLLLDLQVRASQSANRVRLLSVDAEPSSRDRG
jgi:CheY-like chemotaxis protein